MIKISPSIISANFLNLEKEIKALENAGADYLHMDVMDGTFVSNITIGPLIIKQIKKKTTLPIDIHLMIQNPSKLLDDFIDTGGDIITIHAEAENNIKETLLKVKGKTKCGLSVNPQTDIKKYKEFFPLLDNLLIMSVNPGFSGQVFIESTYNKIKEAAKIKLENNYKYYIQVDGGVNVNNIGKLQKAGADFFVAGNAILKSKNYKETISKMRQGV